MVYDIEESLNPVGFIEIGPKRARCERIWKVLAGAPSCITRRVLPRGLGAARCTRLTLEAQWRTLRPSKRRDRMDLTLRALIEGFLKSRAINLEHGFVL